MTPTKVLIGQIAIVLTIVIAASWMATEWAAWHLAFHWRLGLPWFRFLRFPVYYPWRIFEWWYAYEAYAPHVFNAAGMIAASGGVLGAATAVIGSVWRARQSRVVTTYGSARWASSREVTGAGLTRRTGIVLGQWGRNTCGMMGLSTSWRLRRPDQGKASASWCRRCSRGQAPR